MQPTDKPWYLSKGVWLGILVALFGLIGVKPDQDFWQMLNDNFDNIATTVGGLLLTYNRVAATQTVLPPQWLPVPGSQPQGTVAQFIPSGAMVQQQQMMLQAQAAPNALQLLSTLLTAVQPQQQMAQLAPSTSMPITPAPPVYYPPMPTIPAAFADAKG